MRNQSRLEDLRRRLAQDPSSIAFAQLAEEYRRVGEFDAAVDACRSGLAAHPSYLSARITLGRALVALGRFDEARGELARVLAEEPENVGALRGMGELHLRQGHRHEAHEHFMRALHLAPYDAELERAVAELTGDHRVAAAVEPGATVEPVQIDGLRRTGESTLPASSASAPVLTDEQRVAPLVRTAVTIAALEDWLSAIYVSRTNRTA